MGKSRARLAIYPPRGGNARKCGCGLEGWHPLTPRSDLAQPRLMFGGWGHDPPTIPPPTAPRKGPDAGAIHMRIAIVVGHNSRSQGAVRITDGDSEYVWNGDLAERIQKLDPSSARIFKRTPGAGEISRVYGEVADWQADCAIELHFNAFASASAHGCETLYGNTPGSRTLAEKVQKAMLRAMGNHDRGLVHRPSGRGATTVNQRAQPTALIEPYFGSNPDECRLADTRKDALALGLVNAARAFLGKPPVGADSGASAEGQRIRDALEAIGDDCVSALATGWAPDLPDDVKRDRWKLAAIYQITKGD